MDEAERESEPASSPALFASPSEALAADSALRHLLLDSESADEQAELWRQRGNERFRLGCQLLQRKEKIRKQSVSDDKLKSPADLEQRAHKLFHDALSEYSRALALPDCSPTVRGVLHANRAEVHRRLGNYARGLEDARQCIQYDDPGNIKAYYRASACALALGRLEEALQYCRQGLELISLPKESAEHTGLERLQARIIAEISRRQRQQMEREAVTQGRLNETQRLIEMLGRKRIRLGLPLFAQQKKVQKWQPQWVDPLDAQADATVDRPCPELAWPLMVVYPLAHQSDLIERVAEYTDLYALFEDLLPKDGPPALSFDTEGMYRADCIGVW